MSMTRESIWIRRFMTATGVATLTAVLVVVATFNANINRPETSQLIFPKSILFQIREDDKSAALSVIIADNGQKWFVVPRDAVVEDSPGRITVAQSTETLDINSAARQISGVLDVEIEMSWQIDRLAISGLVDSVGGVTVVPLRTQIIAVSDDDFVELERGQAITLTGMYASLYATQGGPQQQLEAFTQVWEQLMLRTDGANLRPVLVSVGSSSRATIAIPELVMLFEKLQSVQAIGGPRVQQLPTIDGTVEGKPGKYLTNAGRDLLLAAGVQPIA